MQFSTGTTTDNEHEICGEGRGWQPAGSVRSSKAIRFCVFSLNAPHSTNNWCTGQPACGSPYTDRVINIQYCNVRITLYIIAFFEVNSISCFVSQRDERKNIPVQVHASLYSNIQQHSYLRWERVNELHWLTDWLTDWLRCVMTTAACNLFKKIRRITRKTNSRNWIMNETNAFTFRRGFSSFWN